MSEYKNRRDPDCGMITFTKTDEMGNALHGGVFTLKNIETGDMIKSKSNKHGRVKFDGIQRGIYTLNEIMAPNGYIVSPVTHIVAVSKSGCVTLDDIPAEITADMCFENHPALKNGELRFYITDDKGAYMKDAVFQLIENGVPVFEAVSDTEGMVSFSGLTEGYYTLMNTGVPNGNVVSNINFQVSVDTNGMVMVNGKTAKEFTSYVFVSPRAQGYNGMFSLIVMNDEGIGICGAEFTLIDKYLNTADVATSDEDGKIVFLNLIPGGYMVYQSKSKNGYMPFETTLPVVISWEGCAYIGGQPAKYYPPIMNYTDEQC